MAAPDRYRSPLAFKSALEARIRAAAGGRIGRFRQLLVFDRFLARVFTLLGERVVLKGGVVLELRLERARTTKDIDLRLTGSPHDLPERLQEAGQLNLGDWLQFEITPDPRQPRIEAEGMPYQGQRFRVVGRLAGKIYGSPFGLDVAVADALTATPELIVGSDFLDFVEIAPVHFRIYPRVTHVAEKLHAYTLPRERPNTRVKDLPDLALLAQTGAFAADALRSALESTFAFRATHDLPDELPLPPSAWATPYARTARLDDLPWRTLEEVSPRSASSFNRSCQTPSGNGRRRRGLGASGWAEGWCASTQLDKLR